MPISWEKKNEVLILRIKKKLGECKMIKKIKSIMKNIDTIGKFRYGFFLAECLKGRITHRPCDNQILFRVRRKLKELCPKGSYACLGGRNKRNFLSLKQVNQLVTSTSAQLELANILSRLMLLLFFEALQIKVWNTNKD